MPDLLSKIESTRATVAVMGLGYVGLPLLAAFHRAGFSVLGFDVDDRHGSNPYASIIDLNQARGYFPLLPSAGISDT